MSEEKIVEIIQGIIKDNTMRLKTATGVKFCEYYETKIDTCKEILNKVKKGNNDDTYIPDVCLDCVTAGCKNDWLEPCHSCHNGSNKETIKK